ncbi:unnamed protein product [Orchesella dallaii]|uniref:Uncharacterized protein n=1 Tax=Orchesella dallaii TaxID=48710 RepID=A0ABP1RJP3_9HEXA
MEVFNENVENEVYPVGQVQIVNFPCEEDRRYSLESEIPDKKVHTGSVQNFRLARHFMDYVSFQEGENPLLNNKLRDITKEEQDELDSLSDEEKARRIRQIIRRRYPAIIKLPPDVETPKGQKRSFESIVSAPERAGALENGKHLPGVSRSLDFDEVPQGTQSSKVLFTFFDEDFMGFSRHPTRLFSYTICASSCKQPRHGCCKFSESGSAVFWVGEMPNWFIQEKQFLSRASKLIQSIIRSYYKGAEMTADYHYNNEVTNAAAMEEEGSSEDASLAQDEATKVYNARMKCIKVARRKLEEGF